LKKKILRSTTKAQRPVQKAQLHRVTNRHMPKKEDKRQRGIIALLLFENLSETDADSGNAPKGERENIPYFAQRTLTTRIETT